MAAIILAISGAVAGGTPKVCRAGDNGSPSINTGLLELPSEIASEMPVMDTAFRSNLLPSSVDLSGFMPPVADQGRQGSCAAFSLGYGLKSYMEGKEEGTSGQMQGTVQNNPYVMSPKYLYHTGKLYASRRNGNAAWGEGGMFMEEALEYLKTVGAVHWMDYGYDSSKTDEYFLDASDDEKVPPSYLEQEAKKYRIARWARIDRREGYQSRYDDVFIQKVKTQLAAENVVPFGTRLDDDFMALQNKSDCMWHVQSWKQGSGAHSGGHAMIAIGYDDNRPYPGGKGAVLIQNSWGKSWGTNGRCWVSYPTFGTFVFGAYYAIDAPNEATIGTRDDTAEKIWIVSGFKIRHGDIIDAITPIYSQIDTTTFDVYQTRVGARIGGTGGGESIETMDGYFVKGLEFQRGLYFGANEVVYIRVIYGKLTQAGLEGEIRSKVYGSGNYVKQLLPVESFMARKSFVVSNIQAISKQHTSGEVFLNNLAVLQTKLDTPTDFSNYKE